MTTKSIAFHSYKGGTGKTTIASNCAAFLAKKGHKVALLDLDVYAPSLLSYFNLQPKRWLNDYLIGDAEVDDIMMDVTPTIDELSKIHDTPGNQQETGKLWIGFCSMSKEQIYKMESGTSENAKSQLRRFILLRETLIRDFEPEFIFIDTSPGIRYWSINALAIADTLFLTLKSGEIDIEGTKRLASEIYGSLTKYGTKSFLLFNRVAGYCTPTHSKLEHGDTTNNVSNDSSSTTVTVADWDESHGTVSKATGISVIASIPCYCDIQFSAKEFLTALRHPNHPFARKVEALATGLTKNL